MRLWVDPYRCVGHSVCLQRAPSLFVFDDERGQAIASEDPVPPELDDEAEDAVAVCPEQAIIYLED
ncbi:MAG: ferredoxin [Acidimicrobiia bacterium]